MNINTTRDNMSMTNVDCNVKRRQGNVCRPKTLIGNDPILAKSPSKSDHMLASPSNDIKKTTMSVKDHLFSSKNKRNDATEVGCPTQSNPMNMKEVVVQSLSGIANSEHTPLKAMVGLVHKKSTLNNCLPSTLMDHSKPNQGEVIIGKRAGYDKLEFAKSNNKKDGMLKVISSNMTSFSDGNQFLREPKTNLGNQCPHMFGTDLSSVQQVKASQMVDNNGALLSNKNIDKLEFRQENSKLCNRRKLDDSVGDTGKVKYERWREPWMEGKPPTNDDIHIEGVVQLDNQTCRPLKKPRRCLIEFEDEHVEDRCNIENHVGVEDDTTQSTPQTIICKDSQANVPSCVLWQSYCCSKPIDEPVWSGIFRINGKEYMSLAGHLSTKSGEKAWMLSKALPPIVNMEKLSRLEIWPKGWETSRPNGNNIGLYFFPHKIRANEELDQLINELMDNDLALRAVIDEVEMVIFTSTLLSQRYQTFQTKQYLWGVFKPKKDKSIVVAKPLTTTMCCAKEVEKDAQQVSNKLDRVQPDELGPELILSNSLMALQKRQWPNASTQDVRASGDLGPQRMGFEPKATQEVGQGDALCHPMRTSETNTTATEATTIPINGVQFGPSMRFSEGRIYGFLALQTPKFEQLIQEMEREGAVVWKERQ